ncbi:GNAT family N-acetyltransferase [Enterococcus sp. 22-H-5-01]|uniref:GNAT family N-acetyltransferase n=1 Tax=Enterococcus sp. 22-H-5-01 TaxID=3418555 RepID=UPI003D003143
MDIRQNQAAELMPFLEAVFQQQDNLHFANEVPQANEKTIALGAWDQGKLIGAVIGKRQYDTLHISLLGVDLDKQVSGIGSALIQAMEVQAVQEKIHTITLTTKAYQALGFYLKQGYHVFGEIADVPMVGTTKYYLAKKIRS